MPKQQQVKSERVSSKHVLPNFVKNRLAEGGFILILTIALFMILALLSYHSEDFNWLNTVINETVNNAAGRVGAYIANKLYLGFGYCAYLLPFCFAFLGWAVLSDQRTFREINKSILFIRLFGSIFLFIGACGLLSLNISPNAFARHYSAGGIIGSFVAKSLSYALNQQGSILILSAIFFAGITWTTHVSWGKVLEVTGYLTLKSAHFFIKGITFLSRQIKNIINAFGDEELEEPSIINASPKVTPEKLKAPKIERIEDPLKISPKKTTPKKEPVPISQMFPTLNEEEDLFPLVPPQSSQSSQSSQSFQIKPDSLPKTKPMGDLPPLHLLDKGQPGKPLGGFTHQELETLSREVEQHLRDFGVSADVVAVHPGPVITRFELQLAAGVKVSKLSSLSLDLARSLSVKSVRVVEIIPGKTVVGIELPNANRAMVRLSEVLSSDVYQQANSPLSMALGVDIAGHPMIVDLGKMPHLLVAGTTGSGKSVGINAMILSLLFKASPEQVRLIMIDPKMLELSVYEGIPHLLTPVVTDMKEAASALRWCVGEMERRYRLMSALGVRNLASFNTKIKDAIANGTPITDPLWKPTHDMSMQAPDLQPLPYIVVIIDELADMMMVVGKKVEQLIARIAQKARAAGIHLILATQRPSVDVLTGLIKSNIPTRISFQVSSKIDSRTILDQQGADQLLGHGDMLFLAPGTGAPLRVHGAFVDDQEVHRVADDWRARGEPAYINEITEVSGDGGESGLDEEGGDTEDADPLYDQAVEFVVQTRKASISSVQRRFKIGYNRAARLIEEMERTGLVGPLDGGSRDVLIPTEV